MKAITIKLTKLPRGVVAFSIFDDIGAAIAENVPKTDLIQGMSYLVQDDCDIITLKSIGDISLTKSVNVISLNPLEYAAIVTKIVTTGCLWRHISDTQVYNKYYGNIKPYIIEYPFSYQNQDEIVQNVIDYTKVYKYLDKSESVFSTSRIETNDDYFNKAILYNGQQSSGLLELEPKKLNNLSSYSKYPKYNKESKTILYTKSDNFYQYNNFWSLNKSSHLPLFLSYCGTNSIDKIINNSNMDYGTRSFNKSPLRAKELKIRHILDNKSDIHLVSQFILTPAQISYK